MSRHDSGDGRALAHPNWPRLLAGLRVTFRLISFTPGNNKRGAFLQTQDAINEAAQQRRGPSQGQDVAETLTGNTVIN